MDCQLVCCHKIKFMLSLYKSQKHYLCIKVTRLRITDVKRSQKNFPKIIQVNLSD